MSMTGRKKKKKSIHNAYIKFTWFNIGHTFTSRAPNNPLLLQSQQLVETPIKGLIHIETQFNPKV